MIGTKTSMLTVLVLCLVVALLASPAWAAKEKGGKRCSDGIDNDGDTLIDDKDPDCGGDDGGGGDPLPNTGNFRITTTWDGATASNSFYGMTIDCRKRWCDLIAEETFDFAIPASYYNAWGDIYSPGTMTGAEECFGGPLVGNDQAVVQGTRIIVREGPDNSWSLVVDYDASFIGSQRTKSHHSATAGQCGGACDDLPPTGGSSSYDMAAVLRTQVGKGKAPRGSTACTCAGSFPDCPFVPASVSVTVERLP